MSAFTHAVHTHCLKGLLEGRLSQQKDEGWNQAWVSAISAKTEIIYPENVFILLAVPNKKCKRLKCYLVCLFVVVFLFSEQKLLPCTLDRPEPPPSHPHTCLGKPKPIMMTGPNAPRSNCILCRGDSRRPQPHMSAWCMHLEVHVIIWML